jgi:hypothetical protein
LTATAVTGGGGTPNSSTVERLSAQRLGVRLGVTPRALRAKRFRGARLSTLVSAYLREDIIKVSKKDKSKSL